MYPGLPLDFGGPADPHLPAGKHRVAFEDSPTLDVAWLVHGDSRYLVKISISGCQAAYPIFV